MWLRFLLFLGLGIGEVMAGEPVDVNQADAVQIASALDGIGQKKAEKIVAWRNEHGAFKSVEDVAGVAGIGSKLAARNKDYLKFGTQASSAKSASGTLQQGKGVLNLPVGAYSTR